MIGIIDGHEWRAVPVSDCGGIRQWYFHSLGDADDPIGTLTIDSATETAYMHTPDDCEDNQHINTFATQRDLFNWAAGFAIGVY